MTSQVQKKFLVSYLIPVSVVEAWSKTDSEEKQLAERKLRGEWDDWMRDYADQITITESAGKTKRVSSGGTTDIKNEIILYSIVEAESHEAAANLFQSHPHLQIPQSAIEIMEVRPMG